MAVINTARLTDNQKTVLCIVKNAGTPKSALGDIANGDENLKQAKNMLLDKDLFDPPLLSDEDGGLSVTDDGESAMKDENLVDDMGELTDEGKQFLQTSGVKTNDFDQGSPLGGMPDTGNPFESFKLLRTLLGD